MFVTGKDMEAVIFNLEHILKIIRKNHAEADRLIDVFTPILLCEEKLLQELAMKKPALSQKKQKERIPHIDAANLPVCSEKSHYICQNLLESMKEALPHLKEVIEDLREAVKPGTARRLCKEFAADRENAAELIENFIKKNLKKAADSDYLEKAYSALQLLLTRACHVLLARMERSLPKTEEHINTQTCPVCGGRPNMSVIRQKEGQRELLCSECGHLWRYSRNICPFCGTEKDKNLELTYAGDNKKERAVSCLTCKKYILETDIRDMEIMEENIHALSLGLAYLDALMQK